MTPASPWIGSTRKATVFGRDRRLERVGVAERDDAEARRERAEAAARVRIGREGDDAEGAAVEVVGADDDLGLALRHALAPRSPTCAPP